MKKSDIKNGMHVITNDGTEYIIISGIEANKQTITADTVMVQINGYGGWMPFDRYDDDLRYYDKHGDNDAAFDISEVYTPNFYAYVLKSVHDVIKDRFIKLWERPIVKKMTKAEIEAELGYTIEIVD